MIGKVITSHTVCRIRIVAVDYSLKRSAVQIDALLYRAKWRRTMKIVSVEPGRSLTTVLTAQRSQQMERWSRSQERFCWRVTSTFFDLMPCSHLRKRCNDVAGIRM